MRKWASLFLALAAAFSLAACGSAGDQENTGLPPVSSGGSVHGRLQRTSGHRPAGTGRHRASGAGRPGRELGPV